MASKDKTKITFHSGILTIGGTVIEVSYKKDRIFFDFGTEYRPELELKEETFEELLKNRLIPDTIDIYDKKFNFDKKFNQKFDNTAVFLSHAHLDHTKMINFLDPDIPLYALENTKAILKSINRNGDFLLPSPFHEKNYTREIFGLEPNQTVNVGEITVQAVPVDHDAYGACALLIHTPNAFLVYSGDLRLHGFDANLTLEFIKKAYKPDLLMMEGVSISFPKREPIPNQITVTTEQELIKEFSVLVSKNKNRQITFNGYPANIKRFEKFIKFSPRIVVLNSVMAALLKDTIGLEAPYYYKNNSEQIKSLDKDLEISYDTLLNDESKYVFQIEPDQISDLKGGGLYIHSDAQPLGDFDPYYKVFLSELESKQVQFVRLALSGHAFPDDLTKIINGIKPNILVPIHTLKPEKLSNPYGERILPKRGQTIIL